MPGSNGGIARLPRRLLYRAHFVFACVFGVLYFLALSATALFSILLRVKSPRGGAFLFVKWWGIVMRGVAGWRMDFEHHERLLDSAPAVVVGNHQSNLDVATYAAFFGKESVVIGKKEIARIPVFGWLWKASGNILVDRGNRESAIASLDEAAARIRSEQLNVWVLAEGHRNPKPELLPFKKGAFRLALAAQVPIVPFVAEPMLNFLDARRWMIRPGRIRVRFLPPVPTAGRAPKEVEALLEEVQSLMQAALDDLRATGRGPID
ncbi:MAG: lysophospholipid acyltransferase family protein [Acidobacteriota bacterium]|nr:lysophospholipid acyltransferase family protein [Acidobacteriota bacterium]